MPRSAPTAATRPSVMATSAGAGPAGSTAIPPRMTRSASGMHWRHEGEVGPQPVERQVQVAAFEGLVHPAVLGVQGHRVAGCDADRDLALEPDVVDQRLEASEHL